MLRLSGDAELRTHVVLSEFGLKRLFSAHEIYAIIQASLEVTNSSLNVDAAIDPPMQRATTICEGSSADQ